MTYPNLHLPRAKSETDRFDVRGTGADLLGVTLQLAFALIDWDTCKGYTIENPDGLVLQRWGDDATLFPVPLDAVSATVVVQQYLDSNPDIGEDDELSDYAEDGHLGWRVYLRYRGGAEELVVTPSYIEIGK